MIEDNFAIPKKELKTFPALPPNIYTVEILDINAEVRPTYKTRNMPEEQKEYQNTLNFQFTLLEGRDEKQEKEEDKNLRGRNVWKNFVAASLYIGKDGKCVLWQIIEAAIGRELTREEEATFESKKLNELIGKHLKIFVENKPDSKDPNKLYDNAIRFMVNDKNLPSLTEEEKDNARVKKEDVKSHKDITIDQQNQAPAPDDDIVVNSVPF